MKYLDLTIIIEPGNESSFPLKIVSPYDEKQGVFVWPPLIGGEETVELELNQILSPALSKSQHVNTQANVIEEYGAALFENLFNGDVAVLYKQCLGIAYQKNAGLRIKLILNDIRLFSIHWELLYDREQGDYVSLSPSTPVSRFLNLSSHAQFTSLEPPIGVLVVMAPHKEAPELDWESEKRAIERALAEHKQQGLVKLTWAYDLTWRDIQKKLRTTVKSWHVLHFIGYGEVNEKSKKAHILLADEARKPVPIDGYKLARVLANDRDMRLVILDTKIQNHTKNFDLYSDMATALLRKELASVLALPHAMSESSKVEFFRTFFDALFEGLSIDQAVAEARSSVTMVSPQDWVNPVLFTQSVGEKIFQMPESKQTNINGQRKKIFLSYKRNSSQDEWLVTRLHEELSISHDVFIDKKMMLGTKWAEEIEKQICESDFLITLISSHSINSEMVLEEIRMAHEMERENGRPILLPIRLNFHDPLSYPLNKYLNPLNWATWNHVEDTTKLINDLIHAISGHTLPLENAENLRQIENQVQPSLNQPSPSAQPGSMIDIELPEGTIDSESAFYMERRSDLTAFRTIKRQGVTITIKGPRQMGKSSLLNRIMSEAEKHGKRVAFLDFQLFDSNALNDADTFYRHFCSWFTYELEVEDRVDEYWQLPLGSNMKCERYIGRYLMREIKDSLVLALDEVETVFDTEFRSDFFGLLRSWHNKRRARSSWKRLDLVLVTSTEPYQLIENINQSPFNVGEVIELADFTIDQVDELNIRHGAPLDREQMEKLFELIGGHPYLVRKTLYAIASNQMTADEFFDSVLENRGPFGDHLRHHLFRLSKKDQLIAGLQKILFTKGGVDELIFFRLKGAGLVKRERGKVVMRNKLYEEYFKEHLDV